MAEWRDEAIVLGNRAHGENHSIARFFTLAHGAQAALVYGGQGKTKGPILQPGNGVTVTWRARREEALGFADVELVAPRAGLALSDRTAVLGLSVVTELLSQVLPEGNAYPQLYEGTAALIDLLAETDIWPILLVRWEIGLLEQLGFGLTLDRCVATGHRLEDGAELVFVSPKSGGAVSAAAGEPYKEKLLPLPPFLIDRGEPTQPDLIAAFSLTAHFLRTRLLDPVGAELPDVRDRLIRRVGRG